MRKARSSIIAFTTLGLILGGCGAAQTSDDTTATQQANEQADEKETFQERPQKPVDGDAPDAETRRSLDEMRAQAEGVRITLDSAEKGMASMPEEERLTFAEKLRVLRERRMNIVKSLDQIEAEEAGPEPERKVFPIDVQKELEQLDTEAREFQAVIEGEE